MAVSVHFNTAQPRPWEPAEANTGTAAPTGGAAIEVRIDDAAFTSYGDAIQAMEKLIRAMREKRIPRSPWIA